MNIYIKYIDFQLLIQRLTSDQMSVTYMKNIFILLSYKKLYLFLFTIHNNNNNII